MVTRRIPPQELDPEWAVFPEEGSVLCFGSNKEYTFQTLSRKSACNGLHVGFGPEAFGQISTDQEKLCKESGLLQPGKRSRDRKEGPSKVVGLGDLAEQWASVGTSPAGAHRAQFVCVTIWAHTVLLNC